MPGKRYSLILAGLEPQEYEVTAMKSGPRLPQLEKALTQKRRPNTAKINKLINKLLPPTSSLKQKKIQACQEKHHRENDV